MSSPKPAARCARAEKNCDLLNFGRERRDCGKTRPNIHKNQSVRLYPLPSLPPFPRDFRGVNGADAAAVRAAGRGLELPPGHRAVGRGLELRPGHRAAGDAAGRSADLGGLFVK